MPPYSGGTQGDRQGIRSLLNWHSLVSVVSFERTLAAVPEPSALGTIAVFGLTMLGWKRRKIQG